MIQALIVALLASIVALGVQTYRIADIKQEIAEDKATAATELAAAERRAREAEQLMADGARKAADQYAKQIARVRTDADGARTELERVRNLAPTSGDAAKDAAAAIGSDDATRARVVVGYLADFAAKASAAADTCEAKLTGLQDWAKAVSK
jgi:hypothetical protein